MTQFLEKKKGTKGGGPVAGGGQGGMKRNGTESCKTEENHKEDSESLPH